MSVINRAIEHPLWFGGICGVLILQAWALHKTRRLAKQIPQAGGQVIAFPSDAA